MPKTPFPLCKGPECLVVRTHNWHTVNVFLFLIFFLAIRSIHSKGKIWVFFFWGGAGLGVYQAQVHADDNNTWSHVPINGISAHAQAHNVNDEV